MNKVEHIGIAVNSVKQAGEIYSKLLNTPVYKTEVVKSQHVHTAFLQSGPNKIELIESIHKDSTIAKFLAKNGEGLHHIAFDVDDIMAEMRRLKSEGFVLLDDMPKRGADNEDMFVFYKFSEFKSVKDEFVSGGQVVNVLPELENCFVFAEYFIHLIVYAIRLYDHDSDKNEVYAICGGHYEIVANSFEEFVARYKDDINNVII
jgi:methylmalonyl-CoA/ethylmalonyl-CoA epimerase